MSIRKSIELKDEDKYTWEITKVHLHKDRMRRFDSSGLDKHDPITDHMKELREIEDRMEKLDILKDHYLDGYVKKRRKLSESYNIVRKKLK